MKSQDGIIREQVALMTEQRDISKRVEGIAERQAQTAQMQERVAQLLSARRARLALYAVIASLDPPRVRIELIARNEGNKTASSYYCDLRVPSGRWGTKPH